MYSIQEQNCPLLTLRLDTRSDTSTDARTKAVNHTNVVRAAGLLV
jgi:hypothetical protein